MKKGQAALEFLTTYGWAFLVILVMIAALAYFGVLNPQKYLPDKCVITTGLDCVDYQILANGSLYLKITNNMGSSLNPINVQVNYTNGTGASCVPVGSLMAAGTTTEFSCFLMQTVGTGNKMKYVINVAYTKSGSSYLKSAYGEIFAAVQ